MPTLDELMAGTPNIGPGVNPELEQMLSRITALQGQMRAPGGSGMPAQGMARGPAMSTGTPQAGAMGGEAPGMQPQQANLTYQALIKFGVPPEVAKQAIANPKFLQEILASISKQQNVGDAAAGAPAGGPAGGPGGGPSASPLYGRSF